jgi:hypothetical protein
MADSVEKLDFDAGARGFILPLALTVSLTTWNWRGDSAAATASRNRDFPFFAARHQPLCHSSQILRRRC